jgi:hypothetical protein
MKRKNIWFDPVNYAKGWQFLLYILMVVIGVAVLCWVAWGRK